MASRTPSILQTRFFYVGSIFAVSLGLVSLMLRFKTANWILIAFGLAWVVVVTAFAWEIVTRAETLHETVRARTEALEESNRNLGALLEQLNAFLHISYELNQRIELEQIAESFVDRLYRMLPGIEAVWLWLHPSLLSEEGGDAEPPGAAPLELAARAGQSFGTPEPMDPLTAENPLAARCFDGRSVAVDHNLPSKALAWDWPWLAHARVESFVGFPLQIGPAMLGVLGLFTRRTVSAEFISQLHLSVNQLTVALEKARLLGETRRRAEELACANEELRQLDAMKDWFVSSVSHELRTPLTNIRSFGEILENYDDLSAEEGKEFAAIIRRESERLTDMINDLLDLARMADGELKLKPRPLEMGELVERCCQPFRREAGQRGMDFSHHVPEGLPGAFADGKAICRVLHNLLSNAFKFTRDGGEIRVNAERAEGDGREMLAVLVTDTGIGIARKDQPRVFDKFTQVHTGFGDRPAGTGIGLAICREIVEKSGGEIWVESRPGRGSTFAFTLPAAGPDGEP